MLMRFLIWSPLNIAPTQMAPVVRSFNGGRRMDMLRWGLIPSWSRDKTAASKLINARGETVAQTVIPRCL